MSKKAAKKSKAKRPKVTPTFLSARTAYREYRDAYLAYEGQHAAYHDAIDVEKRRDAERTAADNEVTAANAIAQAAPDDKAHGEKVAEAYETFFVAHAVWTTASGNVRAAAKRLDESMDRLDLMSANMERADRAEKAAKKAAKL